MLRIAIYSFSRDLLEPTIVVSTASELFVSVDRRTAQHVLHEKSTINACVVSCFRLILDASLLLRVVAPCRVVR